MAKQKISAKQRQARLEAAQRREEAARAKQIKRDKIKRAGIVAVCVVLVLALALPTVALSFLGGA